MKTRKNITMDILVYFTNHGMKIYLNTYHSILHIFLYKDLLASFDVLDYFGNWYFWISCNLLYYL